MVARTWAKISREHVLGAMRSRLTQFHAGRVEVKTHGVLPRRASVYQPTPKPSPLTGRRLSRRRRESYDWVRMECEGSVTSLERIKGCVPLKTWTKVSVTTISQRNDLKLYQKSAHLRGAKTAQGLAIAEERKETRRSRPRWIDESILLKKKRKRYKGGVSFGQAPINIIGSRLKRKRREAIQWFKQVIPRAYLRATTKWAKGKAL